MAGEQMSISPELVLKVLYGAPGGQRFTQDSPVLPEVWLEFARAPNASLSTLIVPCSGNQAHEVANQLHRRVQSYRKRLSANNREPCNISDIPSVIAADLYFDEVVNVVLPLTWWWQRNGLANLIHEKTNKQLSRELDEAYQRLLDVEESAKDGEIVQERLRVTLTTSPGSPRKGTGKKKKSRPQTTKFVPDSTVRLLIMLGMMWCARRESSQPARSQGEAEGGSNQIERLSDFSPSQISAGVRDLFLRPFHRAERKKWEKCNAERKACNQSLLDDKLVFSVSRNRTPETSIIDSVPTIKADAANRLFHISCDRIAWAVIDSGVDATHYAFRKLLPDERDAALREAEDYEEKIEDQEASRVVKKYDLTLVRRLRSRDHMLDDQKRAALALELESECDWLSLDRINTLLVQVKDDLEASRPIDWDIVEQLVTVSFKGRFPKNQHGTHVAGILGGSWLADDGDERYWVNGMCPDIILYDFKVVADTLEDTEFAVIAALRLIRHMNERNDFIVIHGANLSLSILHDVTNYACGKTPVCEECERLINSGVVVVAAAGNQGYNDFITKNGRISLHTSTSITDPGNAENVITVGSTHRREPHSYGISYFSSRGPTGDGRSKPDIIAPGEKIEAPIPRGEFAALDGTSMAAPHVSGAAAMMMARFPELIGNPRRIKDILCMTATDLGRERFFQGHGLLDILRALQSV